MDKNGDLSFTEYDSCNSFEGQIATGNDIGIDATIPEGMTQVCTKLNLISNCETEQTDLTVTRTCTENWTESCVNRPSEGAPSPRTLIDVDIATNRNCARSRVDVCRNSGRSRVEAGDGGDGGDGFFGGGDGGDSSAIGGGNLIVFGGCSSEVDITCNAVSIPVTINECAPVEVICQVPPTDCNCNVAPTDCNCNCYKKSTPKVSLNYY